MRLAVINDYQKLAEQAADWQQLQRELHVDFYSDRLTDSEAAAARLASYDIIVTAREETQFDANLINKLPNLKLLVTHGQRNAALDMSALKAREICVCGTGYGFPIATVELTWGLILSLMKNIPQEDRAIRRGDWGIALPLGLTGRTLGVVGLGELGSGVAKVAQAFGMEVIAWSQNLTDARCKEIGVKRVNKEALFTQADIISVHLVLGDRTRAVIGASEFALMKRTALLINTARGPIVDESALVDALRSNRIAGAGLDVYDQEPLPDNHVLRTLPNTVLMPHVGGRTRENFVARYQDALEDVQAWLQGKPIRVLTS